MNSIRVGICGEFQIGKSLLLNCLLGGDYAFVGNLFRTTPFPVSYYWSELPEIKLLKDGGGTARTFATHPQFVAHLQAEHATPEGKARVREYSEAAVGLPCPQLRRITLVDTPGINASKAERELVSDEEKTMCAVETLDLVIFVLPNGSSIPDSFYGDRLLTKLRVRRTPFVLVWNCCYRSSPWGPESAEYSDRLNDSIEALTSRGFTSWPTSAKADAPGLALWWQAQAGAASVSQSSCGILPINTAWHYASLGLVRTETSPPDFMKRIAEEFGGTVPPPERLRELSRVPELERFLFPELGRSVGVNAYCLGRLHRVATEWTTKVQTQIEATKAALNKN